METLMGYRVAAGTIGTETSPLELLLKESPLKTPNTGTIIPESILTFLCDGSVSAFLTEEN